jgi:Zn-dependent protease
MSDGIPLGKLAGIPVRLHWSWFIALALITWSAANSDFKQYEEPLKYGMGMAAALGMFLSVLLHEFGHCVVARRYGIPVRGIRLFVFGGVAEIAGEPRKPLHEVLLALGGPFVTVALVVVFGACLAVLSSTGGTVWSPSNLEAMPPPRGAGLAERLMFFLTQVNIMLLAFNMIPAFPLDGGRVFRAIVWGVTGNFLTGTKVAGWIGMGFAGLMIVGGLVFMFVGPGGGIRFVFGIWFVFLGLFLLNTARNSIWYAQVTHALSGVQVWNVMQPQPLAIPANMTLRDAIDYYFLRYPASAFPVVRDGVLAGVVSVNRIRQVPREDWSLITVGELAAGINGIPVLHPNQSVLEALRAMNDADRGRLPVVEDGRLVGLISYDDVMNSVMLREALERSPRRLRRAARPRVR